MGEFARIRRILSLSLLLGGVAAAAVAMTSSGERYPTLPTAEKSDAGKWGAWLNRQAEHLGTE